MVPARFASGTRRGWFWPGAFAAAPLVCMGLTGCASSPDSTSSKSSSNTSSSSNSTLMGEGYADNSLGDQVRKYRKPDPDEGFDGVSTKSQQIERDLGVQ